MRGLQIILFTLISIVGRFSAQAQQPTGIVYYDLDRLYDTIPALFYNDTDYTPEGSLRWNTAKYRHKIALTAATIDSMALSVTALYGVENEEVVRDIATACEGDYSYLHRTLNALDGLDFALLYYGDRFMPDYDEAGRGYLYVEGILLHPSPPQSDGRGGYTTPPPRRERIGLLLTRDNKIALQVVDDLREERSDVKLVVLGRVWPDRFTNHGLAHATQRAEQAGRGNVRSRSGWMMRDRILVDTALHTTHGDVFARRYLTDPKSGYPQATFDRKVYRGGISYALPVFVYLK